MIINKFLQQCFPQKIQIELASSVRVGYKLANDICRLFPVKPKYIEEEFRVRALNYTVEASLIHAVQEGRLPFEWQEERNYANNCSHLRLHSKDKDFILTVSQVSRSYLMPREAIFRTHHSKGNQMSLFEDLLFEKPYIILTHGYKSYKPKFIRLGIPEPPSAMGWAGDQIDITNFVVGAAEEIIPERDSFKMITQVVERLK